MGSFLKSGPVVPVCYLDRRAGKSSQGHLESGEACWEAGGGQSGVWTPKRQILHKVQAIAEYAGIQPGPALSPLNVFGSVGTATKLYKGPLVGTKWKLLACPSLVHIP